MGFCLRVSPSPFLQQRVPHYLSVYVCNLIPDPVPDPIHVSASKNTAIPVSTSEGTTGARSMAGERVL